MLSQHAKLGRATVYDVIWTFGDSISRGNSDAAGSTPPIEGSVKQWDAGNSNLRNITNTDLLEPVADGANGSQWPDFGITYFGMTGRVPVFVNCGVGGSAAFNATPGFSWYTNDSLFANALTKLNNCLTHIGQPAPKMVIVGLGYNDAVQGASLSLTYWTSIVDRVTAEFPGVPIYFTMPFGFSATVSTFANQARLFQIRKYIKSLMFTYDNVGIAGDLSLIYSWYSAADPTFKADAIHLTTLGNVILGDKMAQGLARAARFSFYTRSLVTTMWWRISEKRCGWIEDFVQALDGAGYLENIDCLQIFSNAGNNTLDSGYKNCVQDWAFISNRAAADATIIAAQLDYDEYAHAGIFAGDRFGGTQIDHCLDKAAYATDMFIGSYLTYNATAAGTAAAVFGVRPAASGGIILLRQNAASNIGCFAGSTTETTDSSETRFNAAGGFYWLARSSGNQLIGKNGTTLQTAAVASVATGATAARSFSSGNYNNNGTIQLFWAGGIKVFVIAKWSAINPGTLKTIMDNFLTNWLTNVL